MLSDQFQPGQEFANDVRICFGNVILFGRVVFDIKQHVPHELVISLTDRRQTHATGHVKDDFLTRTRGILKQHRRHVDSVNGPLLRMFASGQRDQGGEEVCDEHHALFDGVRLRMTGPTEDGWLANATFKGRVFCASKRLAHGFQNRAVVIREDEQRIVAKSMIVDRTTDLSDGLIQSTEHGVSNGQRIVWITCKGWRWVQRSMHRVESDVQEEGAVVLFASGDHSFCFGSDQVGRVAFFPNGLLVAMPVVDRKTGGGVVNNGFGVVIDAPGVVTILMLKSLPHGKVFGKPLTQMPFAKD